MKFCTTPTESVHHGWFPRLKKLLELHRRSTSVWFLEADARSQAPRRGRFHAVITGRAQRGTSAGLAGTGGGRAGIMVASATKVPCLIARLAVQP